MLNRRGTRFYRYAGRVYVVSMLVLNVTAFGIYQLFGGFGVFRAFALLSLIARVGGY